MAIPILASCLIPMLASDGRAAPVAVLTHHNDNGRTGANLAEVQLRTDNVNTNQFRLQYTLPVDDQVYAQPLVAADVNVPGAGVHNLLIVATVNDSVYAFDADDGSVAHPYWTNRFINPPNIVAPDNNDMSAIGACGGFYRDYSGNIGIVGTPVIDPVAGTIFLVARTKEYGTNFVQRLHALDLTTGQDRSNSPVVITANYIGTGDGSVGGVLTFDPQRQNQRPGLALANGVVYIGWSSHCDNGPYHGWFIGYDTRTLRQQAVFNDTPNGFDGGIWMSGQAPAVDNAGNLYLTTGNGTVDVSGTVDRGESFLKLTPSGSTLNVSSWFTPFNWQDLENGDLDLGSGGLLLIPGTTLAFSGGKEGMAYLVDRDRMGGLTMSSTTNDNIVQSFRVTPDQVHGGAVWWDTPTNSYGYLWPASVALQQYAFDRTNGRFVLPAVAQSLVTAPQGQPGGILSLSANGTNAGSGIVWASHQLTGDANQGVRPGILRAFDAQDVSRELWNSEMLSARDSVGLFAKFVPPTVANGKVYLATFSNRINVYGLRLASTPPSILEQPQSASRTPGETVTFFVMASGAAPLSYQWSFDSSDIPGATDNSYTIANVQVKDAGTYAVRVSNPFGSTNSSDAILSVNIPPYVVAQPQSQTLLIGQDATFTVSAVGALPLAFQWRFNGKDIADATGSTLTLPSVSVTNTGPYSVVVTNLLGSVTSSNAWLTVLPIGAWGDNSWGQLNLSPALTNLVGISAGQWHNLGLLTNNTVTAWGDDFNGQCNIPPGLANIVAVAAGGYHSLALGADQKVFSWGDDFYHQSSVPAGVSNVVAIAAGAWHSLALLEGGRLAAWGDNSRDQTSLPPEATNVVAIAAGGSHNLALRADGTVLAWGENTDATGNYAGQSDVPADLTNVVTIAAGEYHSLAVKADGTVIAWGDNSNGQASPPAGLTNVVSVAGGGSHSVALRAEGTITAWGNDANGQCDVPSTLSNVAIIAAGEAHTLALVVPARAVPRCQYPARSPSRFRLVVQTYAGKNYALEYKDSLSATAWTSLPAVHGNGAMQFLSDSAADAAQRFYRVHVR
jgi:hypothetical protein